MSWELVVGRGRPAPRIHTDIELSTSLVLEHKARVLVELLKLGIYRASHSTIRKWPEIKQNTLLIIMYGNPPLFFFLQINQQHY
jgi:hypothetical protein